MSRYCGDRIAGGAYLTATREELSKLGVVFTQFIQDPPIPIYDPEMMGISRQGQSIVGAGNQMGVYDWVGGDYGSPADFIHEASAIGLSQRMGLINAQKTKDFLEKFKRARFFAYVHPRAIIDQEYLPLYLNDRVMQNGKNVYWGKPCLKDIPEHVNQRMDFPLMCASLWWEDLPFDPKFTDRIKDRLVRRHGGDTSYYGATTPEVDVKITHTAGIFMVVPTYAYNIDVIYDPLNGTHEQALDLLSKAGTNISIRVMKE